MGGPAKIGKQVCYWADNFFICPFKINGKEYLSSQSYFQSMKATNEEDHQFVRQSGPGQLSWQAGAGIPLRHDWEKVKVRVMYEGNLQKFRQSQILKTLLVETTDPIKFGIDYYGLFFIPLTMFWFKWNAKILTKVRAQLRNNSSEDATISAEIEKEIKQYELSIKH